MELWSKLNKLQTCITSGKRNNRLPLLYHCVGYLTLPVDFNIPIRKNKDIFIQTQCNINLMFKEKKNKECKSYEGPKEKPKKIKGIDKEICIDKLNILDEINHIIF